MTNSISKLLPLVAALAAALFFSACGDDDADDDGDSGVEEPACVAAPLECEEYVCGGDFVLSDILFDTPVLPICTTIEGSLTVDSLGCPDIQPPQCLRHVTGDVSISNDPWNDDLASLRSLETVGGNLAIGTNYVGGTLGIFTLDGLSNLREVGDSLGVFSNNDLENVDGLCNLESVQRIGFQDNPALTDVDGLEKITHVEGDVNFRSLMPCIGHPSLQDVEGLRNLSYVGGNFGIVAGDGCSNDSLETLSGLRSLEFVGAKLSLAQNPLIQDLDGLSALLTIGEGLRISSNWILENVDGLLSVEEFGGDVYVQYNPSLPTCDANALVEAFGVGTAGDSACTYQNLDDGCFPVGDEFDCGLSDYD